MTIDVFPFLVSATKKEDFRELVLPDFLGKDDKYAFSRITPGHGRTNDTIYSRKVKLQDGSHWRVFQNSFQTDSLDHVGRNIPRIEGFFVPESKADQVEISKETFAEIRLKLTEYFRDAQKWDRGHPTTVLSEPWQLKPGHQEAVKVLPDLDIRQEVDAFHASAEETKRQEDLDIHQEEVGAFHSSAADTRPPRDRDIRQEVDASEAQKKCASRGSKGEDRLQESGPGWGGGRVGSRDNMGSAKPDAGQAFRELGAEVMEFWCRCMEVTMKASIEIAKAIRDGFSQPSSKGSGKDPSKRDERDPD